MGLALIFSALNVYIRDVRYVVESANVILFWLVPIFYDFKNVPSRFQEIYQFNPVAAVVLASRNILLDGTAPLPTLLIKLTVSSLLVFIVGLLVFRRLRTGFYNYL
jgi:ABC-type polysaccharide/polyol phosphate export permease